MGRAYALAQGEPRDGRRRHPRPLQAASARRTTWRPTTCRRRSPSPTGFDTLAGCFAVGLAPTGAADPFALRRACIGALRTLLDRGYDKLVVRGADRRGVRRPRGQEARPVARSTTVAKIEEFADRAPPRPPRERDERRRGRRGARGRRAAARSATWWRRSLARGRSRPWSTRSEPWLDKARIVAKRLAGISREAQPKLHAAGAFQGSAKTDDVAIQGLVRELNAATENLATEKGVRDALMSMERVATGARSHLRRDPRQRPGRCVHGGAARDPGARRAVHAADRRLLAPRLRPPHRARRAGPAGRGRRRSR